MAAADRSFLGRGWGFPPTFTRGTGVGMVSDEEDIHESLFILFNTTPGERVMVPTYGCQLRGYLFQALTRSLLTQMEDAVRRAILHWEPRIDVDEVRAVADANVAGLVNISVSYRVRTTNARSNYVYPFYTTEATIAPEGH